VPRGLSVAIAEVAFGQLGLTTRDQLIQIGISPRGINHRIEVGLLVVVHQGVYRLAGVPQTCDQNLLAALLAAGPVSAVSHLSSATFWNLEGIACDEPQILIPHMRRLELHDVRVRRTRFLPSRDVTTRRSIRVTVPARTLVDIAGLVGKLELEIALDDALRRKIVTLRQVRIRLDERGPNGIKGWGSLDRLVREREGTAPSGSAKETTFLSGLRKRGLPIPAKQYRIVDADGRFLARPDFAYPEVRIAIEIDSGFHVNPNRRRTDLRRQNAMTLAGWGVLYFDRGDRVGQHEAFATIERAFAVFGEPEGRSSTPKLPKRRRAGGSAPSAPSAPPSAP
jgi:very-short-patch-repair endonuclease